MLLYDYYTVLLIICLIEDLIYFYNEFNQFYILTPL